MKRQFKQQLYICSLQSFFVLFLFFYDVNISFAATKVIPYFKKTVCSQTCETLDSTDSYDTYCKVCGASGGVANVENVTYG